jgi:hypothetical protein
MDCFVRSGSPDRCISFATVNFAATIAAATLCLACGKTSGSAATPGGSAGSEAQQAVTSEYNADGRLTKLSYDRDHDGKIDTWGYMDGTRVVRVEVDENGDGIVDHWEYHSKDAAPPPLDHPGPDPTLERIEQATRYDGKVSRWEYFDHGELTHAEEDTDGDGKIDKWETYTAGVLTSIALDTAGRGTPNRRLVYKDGVFDHAETDQTGSGIFKVSAP